MDGREGLGLWCSCKRFRQGLMESHTYKTEVTVVSDVQAYFVVEKSDSIFFFFYKSQLLRHWLLSSAPMSFLLLLSNRCCCGRMVLYPPTLLAMSSTAAQTMSSKMEWFKTIGMSYISSFHCPRTQGFCRQFSLGVFHSVVVSCRLVLQAYEGWVGTGR